MNWTMGFVFACTFALPALAPAAVITQNLGFNTSTNIVNTNGTNVSPLVFNSFDTSLGALDTVDIRITGNLVVNVTSPPSPLGTPPPPYVFGLTTELEFDGLGFPINPSVITTGTNNGAVMPHALNYGYTFTASLDAASDSLGFAAINTSSLLTSAGLSANEVNAPFMSLGRAAVSANAPAIPFIVFPRLTVSGFSSAAVSPSGTAASTGNIAITYHYTAPAVVMPEPGSLVLLVFGLIVGLRTWNCSKRLKSGRRSYWRNALYARH